MTSSNGTIQEKLKALDLVAPEGACNLVNLILGDAISRSASDVHLEPTPRSLEVRYRLDGVLQPVASVSREIMTNVVARLKVMAELLTYRLDIPQEGAILKAHNPFDVDMRVSTFPTIQGEKAVVRIFQEPVRALELEQLGLPKTLQESLLALLRERTGALLLTGPSGSGKTTTIYACLRHILRHDPGRNIVTIEDPVEQALEGVSQSQARPGTEFDFARGLRSLLRQDPEVIMIGEIRDRDTAAIAIEAALTGHLVFTTLHAGSACGVIARLLEMGVEPYLLTSGLKGILNQRLVRRLCETCGTSEEPNGPAAPGCPSCAGAGYRGRLLLAELLIPDAALRQAILDRSDTTALEAASRRPGRDTIWSSAARAVAEGRTTRSEVERVLGPENV